MRVAELMIQKIKTTSIFSIDYADVNYEQIWKRQVPWAILKLILTVKQWRQTVLCFFSGEISKPSNKEKQYKNSRLSRSFGILSGLLN